MGLKGRAAGVALVALGVLAVAGCGGGTDARVAGASSLPTTSSPASGSPSESEASTAAGTASGEAPAGAGAVKNVHWCFNNDSTGAIGIFFGSAILPQDYEITGGERGTGGPIQLQPGQEACSTGGYLISVDAVATITFTNGRETSFAAYNPIIGYPEYASNWTGSMVRGDWQSFSVGESRSYDRHYNRWTATREPDTDAKEFRIRFLGESGPAGAAAGSPSADAAGVELGRKGVNVCITNDTKTVVRLDWFLSDTNDGNGRMAPGERKCGEGTFAFRASDVIVGIAFDDNLETTLAFNNQLIGYPMVTQDPGTKSAAEACGTGDFSIGDWGGLGFSYDCFDAYDVGDTQTYVVDKYHGFVIKRLPDDQWKQFEVSLRR